VTSDFPAPGAQAHSETSPEAIITRWIAEQIGPVAHIERQGRWRPCWLVDAERDGAKLELFIRGDRPGDWPPMPLSYEAGVFRAFEASGLRVPHVHGFIEEIPAIVMDRARGVAGLHQAESEAARDSVRGQLMEQMVLMHRVDPAMLAAAGAPRPDSDDEAALTYYRLIEELFVDNRVAPAPAIEFVRRWLNRNVPANPDGARPVAVDAAQFLFEGDQLTAMLDFEFAGLGDYHTDLAALRIRNRAEYLGDVDRLIEDYARRSGLAIDPHRVRYHTAAIAILTPLQVAKELAQPTAQIDYHEYTIWNAFCILIALDCIAEMRGWSLETFMPAGEPAPSRNAVSAEALALSIVEGAVDDGFERYRLEKQARVLHYLARADGWRNAFERDFLDDAEALLGRRPGDWREADRLLEELVIADDPAQEEELLRLFTRRYLRECFLLADPEDRMNHEQLTTRMKPLDLRS